MNHLISYRISEQPLVGLADIRTTHNPFKHIERTAPFHVLLYIMKGELPIVEDGTEYILSEGTLFFLKSYTKHWGEKLIMPGTSFAYVHFRLPDAYDSLYSNAPVAEFTPQISLERYRIRPREFRETMITLPKRIDNLLGSNLEYKLKELASVYNSDDPFRKLRVNAMLSDILVDCYRLQFKTPTTIKDIRADEIVSFLRTHRDEPFNSQKIEEHMKLSYKYLEEGFKKRTGMTIQQYHTALRIREAERLLGSSTQSVSEISEQLGYSDPLYFSNVFKKHTGYSPRAYRNSIVTVVTE
ncbi:MAG: helix-turn-helix domain-containing protein [Lachnospiraceae bacterium]|nr:helix-turn-helix domain-containing protein [Lachnospiraceae bacterium]